MLDNQRDDTTPVAEVGELDQKAQEEAARGKKKRLPLEDITRYTMVKRIW